LDSSLQATRNLLEELGRQYFTSMNEHNSLLEERLSELNQKSISELGSCCERLKAELLSHKSGCMSRLDELSNELLDTIRENVSLCTLNIQMHAEAVGTDLLLPRLMTLRQLIGASAQNLREQYKEEVEKAATMKLLSCVRFLWAVERKWRPSYCKLKS